MTLQLQFAFRVRLEFAERRIRFPVRGDDLRGFTAISGGVVEGPMLEGKIVADSGGDWPLFRSDGVIAFDARYLICATDGTLIQVFNRGYAHAPADVQERLLRGETVAASENYFRVSPQFETAAGPHDWLTRSVLVGTAEKHPHHSVFDFFLVA